MKTYFSISLFLLLLLSSTISFGFSVLPSISFYGRVIDQNERPVINAKVIYSGSSTYLSEGGGKGSVMTDEKGYFEIDTTGATLTLGSIIHPDIEYSYQQDSGVGSKIPQERLKSSKRFLSSKDNAGVYDNWKKYTKKENAYNIHVWRLGEYDGATEGNLNVYFNSDGRLYTLDLQGDGYKNQVKVGLQDGQLVVSCIRKSMDNGSDYGDWSVTIAPVAGGIQTTNDAYMSEAPASGYQSSITIVMKHNKHQYQSSLLNHRYYFTSNNGKIFGGLFVHFKPHSHYENNECRIDIYNYKINSTGSRSLELKRQRLQ